MSSEEQARSALPSTQYSTHLVASPLMMGAGEQGGGTGSGEGEERGGEENIVWLCQIRGQAQYL